MFECARSKNFTFSSVKTLVKALYFPRGKDRPFDPAYKEYRFALANAVNQGVSQAVHPSFGTVCQDVELNPYPRMLAVFFQQRLISAAMLHLR